jgi:hypothetical protein
MDNPVEAAVFGNRVQAEFSANLLRNYGIECMVWSDDLGGVGPGQSFIQGVRIVVDASDLDKAREILSPAIEM